MIRYCKAYQLDQLRQFKGWAAHSQGDNPDASGEDLVFVWEDFTVTKDCFEETDYLIDTVTPEWEAFCKQALQFAVPDDVHQAQDAVLRQS